jgi:hypothetical protein
MTVAQTEFAPKVISPPWLGLLAMARLGFRAKKKGNRIDRPNRHWIAGESY